VEQHDFVECADGEAERGHTLIHSRRALNGTRSVGHRRSVMYGSVTEMLTD
jgi:hypothetical protein